MKGSNTRIFKKGGAIQVFLGDDRQNVVIIDFRFLTLLNYINLFLNFLGKRNGQG